MNDRVVSLTAPGSVAAEQYRSLYYRLERLREQRPMRLVAFTSALAGEGKTVTAVNLALTSARANPDRRILLIDADLRGGQVAEMLAFRARPGLSELLQGDAELREVVRRFKANRLAVIPSGAGAGGADAAAGQPPDEGAAPRGAGGLRRGVPRPSPGAAVRRRVHPRDAVGRGGAGGVGPTPRRGSTSTRRWSTSPGRAWWGAC